MFTRPYEIDRAFRIIRNVAVAFLVCCGLLTALSLGYAYRLASKAENRIYLLTEGKVLEAEGVDQRENLAVEARDHVRCFHQLFFGLDPDEKVIQTHLSRAMYLADQTAKREYDNLTESGYYSSLISGNISQQLLEDSIQVDLSRYPYHFRFCGHQRLIRSTTVLSRSLVTEGFLRKVTRSDNDPHGLLIERWVILENKDIKTEAR